MPGVADLHGGVFGEVATYLPGRKVAGVRVEDDHVDIHVSVLYDQPVRATAEAVASRLEPVAQRPVHVTVDDVVLPEEAAASSAGTDTEGTTPTSSARPSTPDRPTPASGSTKESSS